MIAPDAILGKGLTGSLIAASCHAGVYGADGRPAAAATSRFH
jgi:hypothetical protein